MFRLNIKTTLTILGPLINIVIQMTRWFIFVGGVCFYQMFISLLVRSDSVVSAAVNMLCYQVNSCITNNKHLYNVYQYLCYDLGHMFSVTFHNKPFVWFFYNGIQSPVKYANTCNVSIWHIYEHTDGLNIPQRHKH